MTIRPEHRQLLTPAELQVVDYHDLGMGYRMIAAKLGVSVSTVRDRLDRAAARVAAYLDDQEDADE